MVIHDVSDIGMKVSEKRRAKGMTQRDLALWCGVGVRFLSELERGKPTLEISKVIKVLAMLGMDMLIEDR